MQGCKEGRRRAAAARSCWTPGAVGVLVALLLPAAAVAGAGVWTPIGPEAGVVSALAVDPRQPHTVYAASAETGVFKTTDDGDSWAPIDQGIDLRQAFLVTLAASPDGTLLAGGGGIWRSVDGGASWQPSPPDQTLFGLHFAFDPRDARTVYVAAGADGIFKSTDGGETWTALFNAPPSTPYINFQTVAVAPGRRGALLAGSDAGLYRSADGVRWSHTLAACNVQALAFDPSAPGRVYAGCGGSELPAFRSRGGVMVSSNAGLTWKPTALPAFPVFSLAVLPGVAGSAYAATASGVFRTTDGGAHWTRLRGIGPANALAVSPLRRPVLFAGLPGLGVFRSADRGASWVAANHGFTAALVTLLAADPTGGGRLYIGTPGLGAFATRDGGASWSAIDNGLTNLGIAGLAVAPLAPATLYARGGLTDLFASTDAGRTWSARTPPGSLGEAFLTAGPAVDPRDPLHVLVGAHNGAVRASTDGGLTWQVHPVTAGTIMKSIAFAPSAPSIVYASGLRGDTEGTFKSTDGGATWTSPGRSRGLTALTVDPADPATVYATYDGGGVYKTVDGGASWRLASSGPTGVEALALDPRLPDTVIAATGWPAASGVWISRDRGATWALLGSGLPPQIGVLDVAFDAASPETLYAATVFGVYELTFQP
jgi:photosystem II stability/assembly factor-like uncharacterized protein